MLRVLHERGWPIFRNPTEVVAQRLQQLNGEAQLVVPKPSRWQVFVRRPPDNTLAIDPMFVYTQAGAQQARKSGVPLGQFVSPMLETLSVDEA